MTRPLVLPQVIYGKGKCTPRLEEGMATGGGHGNPLWYSCLESPMDRGAWRPTVHGVAKSWTQLRQLSTHTEAGATLSPGVLFAPASFATEPTVSQDLQRCEFSSQDAGGLTPNQQHSCSQNSTFTGGLNCCLRSLPLRAFLSNLFSFARKGCKSQEAGLGWPRLSKGIGAGAASVAWRGKQGPSHQGPVAASPPSGVEKVGGSLTQGPAQQWWGSPGHQCILCPRTSGPSYLQRDSQTLPWGLPVDEMLSSSKGVSHLNFPTGGEYLHDKILHHILHQLPNTHFVGLQERSLLFSFFLSFRWFAWEAGRLPFGTCASRET